MEIIELQGTLEKFIFQNTETGFAVGVIQTKTLQSVIVTGNLATIQPGQEISISGSWTIHPKFGKQFTVTTCIPQLPSTTNGLKKYLGSGLIKGIGKSYAEKLVNYFGTAILEVIENHPQRLLEVEGIGQKRAEVIAEAWKDHKEISKIMIFLQDKDISSSLALKIFKKYSYEAIAVLQQNPYKLAEDIWGVGFKTADAIARRLGVPIHSLARIQAGILFTISQETQQGHLYCPVQELKDKTITLLELDSTEHAPLLKTALHLLHQQEKIKLITHNDIHLVTLSYYYYTEHGVAQKIQTLMDYRCDHFFNVEKLYGKLNQLATGSLVLHEDQQRAILACFQSKVTIITGGPGTGKTTLIKKLLQLLDEERVIYRLAAPTGRAAKRMMEGTGRHALTLHRLLEFDVNTMGFAHNEKNALALDFLIIDEASMIDIFLAHALLKALPLAAHLIFIGDIDQLPSVGAGNFLPDLIASNAVPTIRLTQIFRQAHNSLIIINAHRINSGEFPISSNENTKKDFIFIKTQEPEQLTHHLKTLYTTYLPQKGFSSNDAAVLVPMNRGIVGTSTINDYLQKLINPEQTTSCITHGATTFKLGDRVMQIRNNYDKLVFNGDTGIIIQCDAQEKTIIVNFFDRSVEYTYEDLDELVLAYALSIHKSQGSEYNVAIIPLFMNHFMLLQRNLIYTAITRAKKLCILIGQPKAIAIAIKNNKSIVRRTLLTTYLTTDTFVCR